MNRLLNSVLGRMTMYRTVTVVLIVLVLDAFALAYAGNLDPSTFKPVSMFLTLATLTVASLGSDAVLGLVFGVRVHLESALITALLLWFIYWPTGVISELAWLALIAVVAQASKFVIAVHQRHVVNPAAAGIVLSMLGVWAFPDSGLPLPMWWVANSAMIWVVVAGALAVLWRTGRLGLGLVFVLLSGTWTVRSLQGVGTPFGESLAFAWNSAPIVFFAGFMLSEPLTLPPRRWQKYVVAVVAAVVFTWPLTTYYLTGAPRTFGPFEGTQELALVATGLIALACRQRAVSLRLLSRRSLGGEYVEYTFAPERSLVVEPGQFVEIHVPHRADSRGQRRMFSVVSPPGEVVQIALREPQPGSSFKAALAQADRMRVTSVHGDFTWPRDASIPLLLVAGGIGITPFLSQLRSEAAAGRDVVVVHAVHRLDEAPYAAELAACDAVVHTIEADVLDPQMVIDRVPDLASRIAYISGDPAMVDALAPILRRRAKGIKTDAFLGY